jgi:hypothetical protein
MPKNLGTAQVVSFSAEFRRNGVPPLPAALVDRLFAKHSPPMFLAHFDCDAGPR